MIDTLKQTLDELRKQRVKYYSILDYALDSARSNEILFIAGAYVYVLQLDGTAKIKLNEISGDDIDLFKYRQIASPFYRFFLTHSAQPGKVLSLAIGVGSEVFSLQDFQSPDLSLLSGYGQELRNNFSFNYGTQVAKSNSAIGMVVIVHTVTAGKTLLLEWYGYGANLVAGVETSIIVRDGADVTQYYLMRAAPAVAQLAIKETPCLISIPSGYDIALSAAGASSIFADIKGREI